MAMSRFALLLVCGLALAAGTVASDVADMASDAVSKVTDDVTDLTDRVTDLFATDSDADENIPAVLTAYPGGIFSTLLAAVAAADLASALDSDGPFTVFAPTNEAFAAYLAKVDKTPEEVLASPALKEILEAHVVAGKYTAADVLAMELPAEIATLDGAVIKIEKTADGKLMVAGNEVTIPDIMAANGVIHGIDGVITADMDTTDKIPAVLTAYPGDIFSTLLAAVAAADLAGALDSDGPFTVFAPTNEAFAAYLAKVDKTPEEVLANPGLKEILEAHVVAGKYTAADVLAMELPAEIATLDGAVIKITKTTDGKLMVAGNEVTIPDIMAANGVIHGIDGVITEVTGGMTPKA